MKLVKKAKLELVSSMESKLLAFVSVSNNKKKESKINYCK
jgi:hypothetical protein